MSLYRSVIAPLLFLIDPERAHRLAITALRTNLLPAGPADDPILATRLWGIDFPNPVGLAAGFDKNAEAIGGLFSLGFGSVEIGTVTPRPQAGNPKPRLFRLTEDEAVINRLGFNGAGLEAVRSRLAARSERSGILGVNVGKNRDSVDEIADYVSGIEALAPFANYITVNVSSPNTPGLRDLQRKDTLTKLLLAAIEARDRAATHRPPILVKVAPDLDDSEIADIAGAVVAARIDGLMATNTTIARPDGLRSRRKDEAGGLSGRPLFAPSTRVLGAFYKLTAGILPLVGVGGVASGADAYAKIRAGASLVQFYSAMVYHGPYLVRAIKRDLAARLKADGFRSVADAVGADHR